ncbi:MAG: methytransferase partner Trm112 [Dehalococcoidia bacterium]
MKKDLVELLACPVCKSALELQVDEEQGADVVKGTLLCRQCNETYPIEDSIPNLLPPHLRP